MLTHGPKLGNLRDADSAGSRVSIRSGEKAKTRSLVHEVVGRASCNVQTLDGQVFSPMALFGPICEKTPRHEGIPTARQLRSMVQPQPRRPAFSVQPAAL